MDKKNIISLSGDLASGKGAVSEILMDELSYGIYRNGEYFRKLAKEYNMNLAQFSQYVSNHPEIDIKIEESAKSYAESNDNFIIDARLGWYTVPESFKVYLKVDIDEAAKRAYLDEKRKDLENYTSINEQKKALIERFKKENERYFTLYGIKKDDMSNYDLVVDTTELTPEEVANVIIREFKKWKDK
ncbi:MAG: cytidylate kinase family protein [bacterium]|nr:cytidylate kinase family protein [bacterium]